MNKNHENVKIIWIRTVSTYVGIEKKKTKQLFRGAKRIVSSKKKKKKKKYFLRIKTIELFKERNLRKSLRYPSLSTTHDLG